MTEPTTKPTKSTNRPVGFLRQLLGLRAGCSMATSCPQTASRRHFETPLTALSPSAHWDRVSAIVQVSFLRIKSVNGCQAMARQQLDVADYALQAMMDELRAVMPAQFSSRTQPMAVHLKPDYASANACLAA